jgi:RecA-family ATPase
MTNSRNPSYVQVDEEEQPTLAANNKHPPFAKELKKEFATDHNSEGKPQLLEKLKVGAVTSENLRSLSIEPRAKLLGDWCCEGDLGFLFAFRGIGKTFFALDLSKAIAQGTRFGPWKAPTPKKVVYIDGEMPAELIQERANGLQAA